MNNLSKIIKAMDDFNTYKDLEDGDIVMFDLNGQMTMANIEYVMTEGYFGLPSSKFYTPASNEEPVVLLRIWQDDEETEFMVGRKASEVQLIGDQDDED